MKIKGGLVIFGAVSVVLLSGCFKDGESKVADRWYTQSQATAGQKVFENNCVVCHQDNAKGSLNWKKPLDDGSYPPPPLNGTAHTWHHSMDVLKRTIREGSIPLGGQMPSFGDKLSEEEIEAVIAYFQSHWKAEIYEVWENKVNK